MCSTIAAAIISRSVSGEGLLFLTDLEAEHEASLRNSSVTVGAQGMGH
jgi:hypothetical protein